MSHDVNAQATTMPRAYGWAMLLLGLPVAAIGGAFIVTGTEWWDFVTGAIALLAAAVLVFRGIKNLPRAPR